jgi:ABC-type Fe3+ transport system permease subunit
VAARSKAWTVFLRPNSGIVGSNSTRIMDVCVRLFCVYVVLCIGRRANHSPEETYRLCMRSRNWKSDQGPTKGFRVIMIIIMIIMMMIIITIIIIYLIKTWTSITLQHDMYFKISVLWAVVPHSLVIGYRRFWVISGFLLQSCRAKNWLGYIEC